MNKEQEYDHHLQEIELRALVNYEDKEKLIDKIHSLKPIGIYEFRITDVYFSPLEAHSMNDIPMNSVGSHSVRIRNTMINDTIKSSLNLKVVTDYGNHNVWDELEIEVSDSQEIARMLAVLKYKPFCLLSKTRDTFILESNSKIDLDTIENYGTVVEIEQMTTGENNEIAMKKNMDIFNKLGLNRSSIVDRTATEDFMKRFAFKQELKIEELFR